MGLSFFIKHMKRCLERWGTPDDLQGAAIFLASDAADYVNGHILNVEGG
ncbi:SDR family oxidoreductase [Halobacillus karajensis]